MAMQPIRPVEVPQPGMSLGTMCPNDKFIPMGIRIRLPGSELRFTIPHLPEMIGDIQDVLNEIFATITSQLSLALSHLGPIFTLYQFILEIVHCIQAIPDAIDNGDTQALIECIVDLTDKLVTILGTLFPITAIPPMIADLTCVIARSVEYIINTIEQIIAEVAELERKVMDLIPTFSRMQVIIDEADCFSRTRQRGMMSVMNFMNDLIDMVNNFGRMAGEEALPIINVTGNEDLQQMLVAMNSFKQSLSQVPSTCLVEG